MNDSTSQTFSPNTKRRKPKPTNKGDWMEYKHPVIVSISAMRGGGIAERNDGKLVTALELNMRYPTYNEWKVQSSIYLWESESVAEEIYFSGYKGNSSYRSILSDIKVSNSHEENNCVFGERFYEEEHWFETKCLRNNITYTITVADYSASDDYEGITVQDIGNKLQSKIEEKLNKIRLP